MSYLFVPWGGRIPPVYFLLKPPSLWGATETTFHSSEKWKVLSRDAWDNFDNTGKNLFRILKFWGISDIFDGFMTSLMSVFFVILQFFVTASVIKSVETLDFHIEYVFWQDLPLCQV